MAKQSVESRERLSVRKALLNLASILARRGSQATIDEARKAAKLIRGMK